MTHKHSSGPPERRMHASGLVQRAQAVQQPHKHLRRM